jgi:hypothetical protein
LKKATRFLIPVCLSILIFALPGWGQEKPTSPVSGAGGILDEPSRIFDLDIPEGFKSAAVEEPGVMKWTRADGQIHLVVGGLHVESSKTLFDALKEAVEKNEKMEGIKTLDYKNGRGLMFRNKAPEDKQRLRIWRLFVVTDEKAFTLECSAPQSQFEKFVPQFEQALNSFKLKAEK